MPTITLVLVILAALFTFVLAAVVVGREAHRLDALAPRVVYVEEQAVAFVAERLPAETQARLTLDELAQLLTFHLRWLNTKGLQPDHVIDRRQDISTTVVVEGDDVTAYLIGEAERNGVEVLDDIDVVHVVDAHQQYFDAIGAVGPLAGEIDG
ncbi:unannotated protein [freshwater metagenome]|uniref:Unannotated protein n=1 Tax=freshwater metagenome TaxID=449393 RepID=A0A6J7EZD0_9ZZZZ|nr:hypothetical protein [Actinomycetota bacterium]